MMSDKSVDVILTDMALIYVDPLQIDSYLKEFRRVARSYVVICEFHSKSWWKRQIARLGGYHVYDYQKRLEKLGFFNVQVQHIPDELWPGTDKNTEFRSIITARV
jgi:ubiquinone/menaquinone biosynthesis C-methylase UbiE